MDKRRQTSFINIASFIFLVISPIIAGILYCKFDGKKITDIYIPLSGWNDELTYYKQIEAIINGGIRGFFGYNQSRAAFGGYAAWGPIPLLPYVAWGKLFGWNLLSPIIANIAFFGIGLAFFSAFLKPSGLSKFEIGLTVIFLPIITRHVFSGLTESFFIGSLVIVISCFLFLFSEIEKEPHEKLKNKEKRAYLYSIILISLLTIMRGYYAVFFLILLFRDYIEKKKKRFIVTTFSTLASMVLFALSREFLCASYYNGAIGIGIGEKIKHFPAYILEFFRMAWYAVRYKGATVPWSYATWILTVILLIVSEILFFVKERKIRKIRIAILFSEFVIWLGILILYSLGVGGRHFLSLIVINVLILAVEDSGFLSIPIIVLGISQFFLISQTEHQGYFDKEFNDVLTELSIEMNDNIKVGDNLSFENVIAMPTSDHIEGETPVSAFYGYLFATPKGMGISLDEEILYSSDELKAKYYMVHSQGDILKKLKEKGMISIIVIDDITIMENLSYLETEGFN